MQELLDLEDIEFVAECMETEERVAFTISDLCGWDDETVFLDISIYLNKPREKNWAIICRNEFSRTLNPKFNIHLRTEEDGVLREPLKLLSIKQYSRFRFEAEFSNHVVRTGSFLPEVCRRGKLPFYEDEFELARMHSRGIQVRRDVFISAMNLWEMSAEYVHYGCNAKDYDISKFEKIKNIPLSTKPSGGFWASPTRIGRQFAFDWASFCRRDDHHPRGKLYRNFLFCLNINARIVRIETPGDFDILPKVEVSSNIPNTLGEEFIDFEECVRQGIDAIEYAYTAVHQDKDAGDRMDIKMLGWDCDSILILNPKIILENSFLTETTEKYLMKG